MSTERKQGVLLLPCPFCGSINLRYQFSGSQGYIECNECGTQGPCDERAADPICDIEAANSAWNRRTALAQPEPEGVTERIAFIATAVRECAFGWEPTARLIGNVCAEDVADLCGAVLARWGRPAIEPVPVAERLPGPEDCTAQGWCWVLYRNFATWTLEPPLGQDGKHTGYTHWLPHHALPIPQQSPDSPYTFGTSVKEQRPPIRHP
jgi:hypothetical protein